MNLISKYFSPTDIFRISRLHDKFIPLSHGGNRFVLARDVFILSFCLLGINTADLYELSDYKRGRLSYKRAKTRTRRENGAFISVKVETEAKPIMSKYRDRSAGHVFNFHKRYSNSNEFNVNVNKGLKMVGAEIGISGLTFYAARHSWATIAYSIGVDIYTIHKALNHAVSGLRVTEMYITDDWSSIDAANRKVLDYVFIFKPFEDSLVRFFDMLPEIAVMIKQE